MEEQIETLKKENIRIAEEYEELVKTTTMTDKENRKQLDETKKLLTEGAEEIHELVEVRNFQF